MAKTRDQFVAIIADALGKSQSASSISGTLLSTRCIDFLNWGEIRIARAYSFDELDIDITTPATVISVKTYPLITGTNNLGLIRPKDIESILLLDSQNSIKLERWPVARFDKAFPRPENYTTGRPTMYIRYGYNLVLFRIPDAVYSLEIRYPQWPTPYTSASQTSDFQNKDDLIISSAILEGYLHFEEYTDAQTWAQRFTGLLNECVHAEGDMDWEPTAQPMAISGYRSGSPWIDAYADSQDPLYNYP